MNTPIVPLPGTFRERLALAMERHAEKVDAGEMRHGALHLDRPVADELARLRGVLGEVLAQFNERANLGGLRLRTGWIPEDVVERWRTAAGPAPVEPLPARLGQFWCCPDHPGADVRRFGAVACCMETGCGYGPPPASGSDGAA